MKHKVVKYFTDLQDNNHAYHAGDLFPREGLEVSAERLDELSSNENRRGIPLIEKVFEEEKPIPASVEVIPESESEVEIKVEEPAPKPKKSGRPKKEKVNSDAE